MKTWRTKRVPGVLTLAILAGSGFAAFVCTDAAATPKDREPPAVVVHPPQSAKAGEPLTVGAQIVDPSGIGNVVLWVRGEHEEEYRQISMEHAGEDLVHAEVQPWPEQGAEIAYYIEARDGEGNGPGFAGGPRTPYIIHLKGAAVAPAEAQVNWVLWSATAGSLLLLVGGYLLYRRFTRDRIHADVNAELQRLTGIQQETIAAVSAHTRDPVRGKRKSHVPQNPAEQAFWIGLLSSIGDMSTYERDHALQTIAARAQHHPTLGKRFFDVGTLNRHLEWVERGDH